MVLGLKEGAGLAEAGKARGAARRAEIGGRRTNRRATSAEARRER